MFGVSLPELIVILIILLLVFGAARLPEIGHAIGKAVKEFKKASLEEEKYKIDKKKEI